MGIVISILKCPKGNSRCCARDLWGVSVPCTFVTPSHTLPSSHISYLHSLFVSYFYDWFKWEKDIFELRNIKVELTNLRLFIEIMNNR